MGDQTVSIEDVLTCARLAGLEVTREDAEKLAQPCGEQVQQLMALRGLPVAKTVEPATVFLSEGA